MRDCRSSFFRYEYRRSRRPRLLPSSNLLSHAGRGCLADQATAGLLVIFRLFFRKRCSLVNKIINKIGNSYEKAWDFLFFLYALFSVILISFLNPPFQSPDEQAHFFRIVQIADGGFLGHRQSDLLSGGFIDLNAVHAYQPFTGLPFNHDAKLDARTLQEARELGWSGPVGFAAFPNTSIYPPVFYLPAAAAVWMTQISGGSVLDALYAARVANGLVSLLIATAALWLCRVGKSVLFTALAFPMTLYLFASCSQDAPLIACAALAFGLVSRVASGTDPAIGPVRWSGLALLALVVLQIVLAKPPYVPLLLLVFLPVASPAGMPGSAAWWRERLALFAGCLIVVVLWLAFIMTHVQVPMPRPGVVPSASAQMLYMVSHPVEAASALLWTLWQDGGHFLRQMVGVLGWLDTILPETFYRLAGVVTLCAILSDLMSEKPLGWPVRGLTAFIVLATSLCILTVQYLTWTAVGDTKVDGVQGRYFLPIILAVGMTLPALRFPGRAVVHGMLMVPVMMFPLASLGVMVMALVERYYLR